MVLAIFSDIHSNHTALQACFAEAERRGAEQWIFLGDYVSDCACPHKTMELLYRAQREHTCYFILGNREEYMLQYRKNGGDWNYRATTGSLLYTYEHLTEEDFEFLEQLPFMQTINPNGKCPIRICHGSPQKTRETLNPNSYNVEKWMLNIPEPILLSGHSHQPLIAREGENMYVNPGSVGIQMTGTPKAQMAFLTWDGDFWVPELCNIPYDIDCAALEMQQEGLLKNSLIWGPAIYKQLYTAKNYSLFCLQRAEELAAGGEVTRAHWIQAAKDFHIIKEDSELWT